MLGGCEAQYGAPGDFDQWANINQDDSWSWKNFSQYFTKFEKYSYDPEYPDLDPKTKGSDGPVRIGYFSDISQSSKDFIDSCTEIGIPHSADFNNIKSTGGVNRAMTYIDQKRERVSSESAYLTGDVLARPNLKVAICAQVTQILFEKVGDTIRATGVEFSGTQDGPRYRAKAKSEIIVAGGAIHSPQILMLSGVGPAEQLQKHDIPVIHNLPGVGSNLVDHPVVGVNFKDKQNDSRKFLKPQSISTTSAVDSPDLEIFTSPLSYKDHGTIIFPVHSVALHSALLRPMSTGKLTLKSNNPWDSPAIDPKYLEAPEDVQKLIRGIKLIFKIAKAEPLTSSDEELEKIVRERVASLNHPTGTCRMAPLAEGGVGLRVCDASIFPSMVSGHTVDFSATIRDTLIIYSIGWCSLRRC
ncbi:GMC oxidoreductase-domain-containing protein [Infundibulicybe gibba]|nr:GMC oxidoreductase-domain-containing protein [Infundibulicybe gibba]